MRQIEQDNTICPTCKSCNTALVNIHNPDRRKCNACSYLWSVEENQRSNQRMWFWGGVVFGIVILSMFL